MSSTSGIDTSNGISVASDSSSSASYFHSSLNHINDTTTFHTTLTTGSGTSTTDHVTASSSANVSTDDTTAPTATTDWNSNASENTTTEYNTSGVTTRRTFTSGTGTTILTSETDNYTTGNLTTASSSNVSGFHPLAIVLPLLIVALVVLTILLLRRNRKRKRIDYRSKEIILIENGHAYVTKDTITNATVATEEETKTNSSTQSAEAPPTSVDFETEAKDTSQPVEAPPTSEEDFLNYVNKRQEHFILYQAEFTKLRDSVSKTSSVARKPGNIVKNRYANILPYDDNRVILQKTTSSSSSSVKDDADIIEEDDESGFINASFIDGARKKKKVPTATLR